MLAMQQSPMRQVPFNRPYMTGRELHYIAKAQMNSQLAGDGSFTKQCQTWLKELGGSHSALLTHSCTAALEMAAILSEIGPGDEVILPSYTFVSTANAFVLRGATPVFVDIRPDTLNLDESQIEAAITHKTKAIVPVHYAGYGCDMDAIMRIAKEYDLLVIEDAAQACMARYNGKSLGSIGHLGCYSFHETKNIISGEGGALLINDPRFMERAEIIREKGTNRSRFFRGQVDKYTWVDTGSSFLPGEIIAAFLWAQIEEARAISDARLRLWDRYYEAFAALELQFKSASRPPVVPGLEQNAHMFYLLNRSAKPRDQIIADLRARGVSAVFHYVPLHSSPYGKAHGRAAGPLSVTDHVSENLIRLPLWNGMQAEDQDQVIEAVYQAFASK